MFKLIGILLKTTLLAFASLVIGNLVTYEGKSLSQHIETGLVFLNIKQVSMNQGLETLKELPDGAKTAADQIKRAWHGVPVRNNPNPHLEDHPTAARKDLRQMLQELKASNEQRKKDLNKSLE
jgi:hypothetical protein